MRTFALLFLLPAALCADAQQKVNPVEKVITLLEKLQGEIEEEGKTEAAAYDKFACFCKEQADDKQYAIEKAIEAENMLSARISDHEAQKNILDQEVMEHNADVETEND